MPEYDYCEVRYRGIGETVNVTLKPIQFLLSRHLQSMFIKELNELLERYINDNEPNR